MYQLVGDLAVPVALGGLAHYMRGKPTSSTSARRTEMVGGAPFVGMVLQTVNDLIVPLGLVTGAHLLGNRLHGNRGQQRGGAVSRGMDLFKPLGLTLNQKQGGGIKALPFQAGGAAEAVAAGSSLPIIGDSYLGKWLSERSINILTPSTLVPLGIVFILYMAYRQQGQEQSGGEVSRKPNIYDLARTKDIASYRQMHQLETLEPETKVPFALAMGQKVFRQYVKNDMHRSQ